MKFYSKKEDASLKKMIKKHKGTIVPGKEVVQWCKENGRTLTGVRSHMTALRKAMRKVKPKEHKPIVQTTEQISPVIHIPIKGIRITGKVLEVILA